jgi:hypothetical protein
MAVDNKYIVVTGGKRGRPKDSGGVKQAFRAKVREWIREIEKREGVVADNVDDGGDDEV